MIAPERKRIHDFIWYGSTLLFIGLPIILLPFAGMVIGGVIIWIVIALVARAVLAHMSPTHRSVILVGVWLSYLSAVGCEEYQRRKNQEYIDAMNRDPEVTCRYAEDYERCRDWVLDHNEIE